MYGPPDGASPGQITATRLLPHGHAFFLTPSFLIADPERAFVVVRWFIKEKLRKSTPGTWKLVCAHNIRDYLLNLAIEKSAEKDEVEVEYQGNPLKDAIIEERGLSYTMCKLRFQVHELVTELLSQQVTEGNSEYDSDIPDESASPVIYASEFIDADDEQGLVTWFAGWAMCKLDQFRKFTVIGSGPRYEKRAVRRKKFISQPPSPKRNKRSESKSSRSQKGSKSGSPMPNEPSNSAAPKSTRRQPTHYAAISPTESSIVANKPVKYSNGHASNAEFPGSAGKVRALAIAAKLNASAPASPLSGLREHEKNPFDTKAPSPVSESTATASTHVRSHPPRGGSVGSLGGYTVTLPQQSSSKSPPADCDTEMSIDPTHVYNPQPAVTKHGIDLKVSPDTLQFIIMTGSNLETAKYFLARSKYDIHLAVEAYKAQAGPVSQLDGVDDSMDIDEQVTRAIELYGNNTNVDVRSPSFNNSFTFSPPQFDRLTDDRPRSSGVNSTSSNRSGIQTDENDCRVVPNSVRPCGPVRPKIAIKTGNVPGEDRDVYQIRQHSAVEKNATNSGGWNASHQGSPNSNPSEEQEIKRMEVNSSALEKLATGHATQMMDISEIMTKEIKYEPTTTWYARWYKDGKGWEHIYVEGWEKAFKYLGVK